ncbi:dTDP-glucose 4,6-dehydratase [Leptolyngbya cf. ectocarpi LEGE 11479]|uniref:dTDP-glucose 4,6-dehydratase n=1 Tax=Leptolyngbya cf. ectocarpi LEGE 11479 TaxID=1828722 RepID=A0A928ZXD7_LEPEC|nr:dTDP-glucose 4,6-dehydratase [Leptolyngbya ectocarpi]MBE9069257.1 dTDP-glucose 4,6-dehydratase [Leptolyngbya cf. ectocarpi LEGE 11479]
MINSRRILVTGGAGFIGSNFVHYWHKHHPDDRIIVLDLLTYAGNRKNLQSLEGIDVFKFVQGDICDRTLVHSLFQEENIDTVVHFAAESHVDRSILNPDAFIKTNVIGTFTLLDTFKHHWQINQKPEHYRFHHISTDEVYGSLESNDSAFSEVTPYSPNSPYSASKAGSDHLIKAYYHTYGLPTLITNCSNNYGPYHFPEKLIPLMCVNLMLGKPLPVYGDGQNIRDWLYVEDHCSAIEAVLTKSIPGETYNIGGNNEIKNIDLVHILGKLMEELAPDLPVKPYDTLIKFVKDRPGHDYRYAIDATKIQTDLGWYPSVTVEEGLCKTVQWYLDNNDWWQPLLSADYKDYYEKVYG